MSAHGLQDEVFDSLFLYQVQDNHVRMRPADGNAVALLEFVGSSPTMTFTP